MESLSDSDSKKYWHIVSRWQEYKGETRVCLLRIVSIAAFYAVQLIQYYSLEEPTPTEQTFQSTATLIAASWTLVSLAVLFALQQRFFPAALKYISTVADVILLTTLALYAAGPHSSLTRIYFLIIALATLRFSLPLIRVTTVACMLGYLCLTAQFDPGQWFDKDHAVEPIEQIVVLLSLAISGIVLGQIVRVTRNMGLEFHQRAVDGADVWSEESE